MKKIFALLLLFNSPQVFSQDWPVKKMVTAKKQSSVQFTALPVFSFVANKPLANRGIYQELKLDASFLNRVMEERPAALQLSIPLGNGSSVNCELVQFSLGNVKFTENNSSVIENIKIPVTYRGIIAGVADKNSVMLTVNEDYLSLVAAMNDKSIQVTQADEKDKSLYRLYNSETVQFPSVSLDCGTISNFVSKTATGIDLTGVQVNPLGVQDKCVNVFVDCFDSVYLWQKSNTQQTTNYVYELFNIVAGGYLAEQINIQITTINIWTTPDPFTGNTREARVRKMADYYKDNFWGNICVGLDFTPSRYGGVANAIGKVKAVSANTCPAYSATESACCYNDLADLAIAKNFPVGPNTNNSQIYLVMHEIGHKLGSRHTKWCGWKLTSNPDTFGAIDSCGVPEEGPCAPGQPPINGGTIMSYCFQGTSFINYSNGFGPLPGNAIRNFVDQSPCILTCVECFGVRNNSNKHVYAFQNAGEALKKESGTGENNSNGPTKNGSAAGKLIINTQKLKQ